MSEERSGVLKLMKALIIIYCILTTIAGFLLLLNNAIVNSLDKNMDVTFWNGLVALIFSIVIIGVFGVVRDNVICIFLFGLSYLVLLVLYCCFFITTLDLPLLLTLLGGCIPSLVLSYKLYQRNKGLYSEIMSRYLKC